MLIFFFSYNRCCAAAWEKKMRDKLEPLDALNRKGAAASAAVSIFHFVVNSQTIDFLFSSFSSSLWSPLLPILFYGYSTDHPRKVIIRNHLLSAVLQLIETFLRFCSHILSQTFSQWVFFCILSFGSFQLFNSLCFSSSSIINRHAYNDGSHADASPRFWV